MILLWNRCCLISIKGAVIASANQTPPAQTLWPTPDWKDTLLMRFTTLHHRIIDGLREVTQQRLFRRIVSNLLHHHSVLSQFIAHGAGVVDHILVGEIVRDKKIVQPHPAVQP